MERKWKEGGGGNAYEVQIAQEYCSLRGSHPGGGDSESRRTVRLHGRENAGGWDAMVGCLWNGEGVVGGSYIFFVIQTAVGSRVCSRCGGLEGGPWKQRREQ
jgi:hypothetical protein